MLVMPGWRAMDRRLQHCENVWACISVTLTGITTDLRSQPANAVCPMVVSESGRSAEES